MYKPQLNSSFGYETEPTQYHNSLWHARSLPYQPHGRVSIVPEARFLGLPDHADAAPGALSGGFFQDEGASETGGCNGEIREGDSMPDEAKTTFYERFG